MSVPPIQVNREIASIGNGRDITRGYTGPMLIASDRVLRNRGGGDLAIYEQVLSEPQVKATFEQRRKAVVKCEWVVDAASDSRLDRKAADHARKQLQKIGWDRVTDLMLFGVFYGYAVAELIWERQGELLGWSSVKVRNRRRFRFDADAKLRLLTPQNALLGEPADAPYFWHFATGADNDDEPYGLGLAHWCYWPALFKRNGIKFWLVFAEKFGMPTAVGKYDVGATDIERSRLLAAVGSIQTDAGIIMPKDMEVDLLEAARNGTADYKVLHDTMDDTIAKAVIGQTASSQGTPGRLGNDQLQSDVRQDIVKADADLVCESFNLGPMRWLTERNFPGAGIPRVYRVVDEPEDLTELADRDIKVKGMGFKPGLEYVRDTYGEHWEESAPPEQLEGDPLKPGQKAPSVPQKPEPAFADAATKRDYADALVDALAASAGPVTDAWLEQIRVAIDQAKDYDELLGALSEQVTSLSIDQLALMIEGASTAANLAGRDDVGGEARGDG